MWGMYWRYMLSIFLSLILVAFLSDQLDLLNAIKNTALLPTVFWGIIALIYAAITIFQNKGFPYVFFGITLRLSNEAWYKFNFMVISLFVVLAVLGYFVGQTTNTELWSLYKLYGQSAGIVFLPLLGAWFTTSRAQT